MINKQELADILKVSVPTIERYMTKGMPYLKMGNGSVRFELEKVIEWAYEKKGE